MITPGTNLAVISSSRETERGTMITLGTNLAVISSHREMEEGTMITPGTNLAVISISGEMGNQRDQQMDLIVLLGEVIMNTGTSLT